MLANAALKEEEGSVRLQTTCRLLERYMEEGGLHDDEEEEMVEGGQEGVPDEAVRRADMQGFDPKVCPPLTVWCFWRFSHALLYHHSSSREYCIFPPRPRRRSIPQQVIL